MTASDIPCSPATALTFSTTSSKFINQAGSSSGPSSFRCRITPDSTNFPGAIPNTAHPSALVEGSIARRREVDIEIFGIPSSYKHTPSFAQTQAISNRYRGTTNRIRYQRPRGISKVPRFHSTVSIPPDRDDSMNKHAPMTSVFLEKA